jgi:glutathione S-transferase
MLLVEEKQIPMHIQLVNMRSYGDKPSDFLKKVPSGLLPALEVTMNDMDNGRTNVITESAIIMQLLDEWHTDDKFYKPMVPPKESSSSSQYRQYQYLMQLERELFRWWCTFMFRPESNSSSSSGGGVGIGMTKGALGRFLAGGTTNVDTNFSMSPQMQGFLQCLEQVNTALSQTRGPFFLDFMMTTTTSTPTPTSPYPTMIDFVFASHVERMVASCAYWKGMDLRSKEQYPQLQALQQWMDALEQKEYYLAFKSDYYTHIKDIPPQYGPSYPGISFLDRIDQYQAMILGQDDTSWTLPLSHDDQLQPLYRGPPLPLCVLNAVGIMADTDGTYQLADPTRMSQACRQMAAWKLCGNGPQISIFSSRGGPNGSKNPRKTFGAELADPYAERDTTIVDYVDAVLRIVGLTLHDVQDHHGTTLPTTKYVKLLTNTVPKEHVDGVISSLAYLRDRIGVPRDLPLASARYLRAYLNWSIDTIASTR